MRSVGTFSGFTLQGATFEQVLVLEDGITLNWLDGGAPGIASIPVRNVERVEIVKGPGSSAWGVRPLAEAGGQTKVRPRQRGFAPSIGCWILTSQGQSNGGSGLV